MHGYNKTAPLLSAIVTHSHLCEAFDLIIVCGEILDLGNSVSAHQRPPLTGKTFDLYWSGVCGGHSAMFQMKDAPAHCIQSRARDLITEAGTHCNGNTREGNSAWINLTALCHSVVTVPVQCHSSSHTHTHTHNSLSARSLKARAYYCIVLCCYLSCCSAFLP